ncbi:bacterio-opsin activator domain-containing protein [Halorientalis halophila]|uniref:bacterio-opsin activator domain-containing protein n=1 Tax=Halorientalis halophila TaxID=3108499 RepID=UPI0030087C41
MSGPDTLDVLLIEDNPGDARLIEEMLREAADLLQRVDVGGSADREPKLHHVDTLAAGLERLEEDAFGAILLDLNLPDSTGLDTLAALAEGITWTPIVVLTGVRDESVGIEAIQRGAQDYLIKGEVTSDLLVRSLRHAVERARQEREREKRREQLAALNRLNEISQDVTHTVITTATRDDLERAVCERLAASDAYRFAWIGEIDRGSDRLVPRAAAGVEADYLEDVSVPVTDTGDLSPPGATSVRTHEVAVVQNVQTDPDIEPWRAAAEERGYRSIAAVPIVHEDVLYGVLGVYAAAPNAFSEPEREILGRLGEVIGHAIAAIERKAALVSDEVLELEFRADGAFEPLVALAAEADRSVDANSLIRVADSFVAYGRVTGISETAFRGAADAAAEIDEVRILGAAEDGFRFELRMDAVPQVIDAVGTHGGAVTSARIADGELRFLVEFPPGRDKRRLIDLVEDHCPAATPRAQRTVTRTDRADLTARSVFRDELTEKQRTAVETAYFAGFFDWPRESTGQEVADRLGVAPATFTQHLRAAERALFEALFEAEQGGEHGDGERDGKREEPSDVDAA